MHRHEPGAGRSHERQKPEEGQGDRAGKCGVDQPKRQRRSRKNGGGREHKGEPPAGPISNGGEIADEAQAHRAGPSLLYLRDGLSGEMLKQLPADRDGVGLSQTFGNGSGRNAEKRDRQRTGP